MEERVNIGGKTYIVPAGKVGQLIMWLESNAVDASHQQVFKEVQNDSHQDPRSLLLEKS